LRDSQHTTKVLTKTNIEREKDRGQYNDQKKKTEVRRQYNDQKKKTEDNTMTNRKRQKTIQ
jgi:hypothetical protein